MNRRQVRLLFILIFPFLLLQYWIVLKVEQPFPAFYYPMFQGVSGSEGLYRTQRGEILVWSGGKAIPVESEEIFVGMEKGIRVHVMRRFFGPASEEQLRKDAGFQAWLFRRIRLTQGMEADSVVVSWSEERLYTTQQPFRRETVLVAKVSVVLKDRDGKLVWQ